MSPQEFEQALHDAEVKLARLKALYEQWFQGIERLEPSVPRKELDRTIDLLKKSVPRNTALRFRMQQLVARYGTYGIYWGRIARQIEEGTYKRDVIRVNKKRNPKNEKRAAEQAWELDVEVEDVAELDDEKTDPGIVVTGAPAAASSSRPATASSRFGDDDLDAILGALAPAPDDPGKTRSARPLSPFAMGAARAPGGASATFGKPKDRPASGGITPPTISTAPAAPTAAPTPATPPRVAAPASAAPIPTPPKPAAPVATPPKPAAPIPTPARPLASPPMPPKPAIPAAAKPPVPTPAAAPRPPAPTPAAVAPRAPTPAASASGDLDERQMRAIYSRYVDARKQNNERTDVRYEVLAESVKKMIPKLREKHAGKAIDFEVVLQNGKVGLKPKVGG